MIASICKIFNRDLQRLYSEIQQYNDEKAIWATSKQVANSAGNLCLHLIGNLNTYIGKELGGTGYVRNREQEFLLKDIPRDILLSRIQETMETVSSSLSKLDDAALERDYPILVLDEKTSTGHLLVHLTTHLTYHLGQVNYHRRLLDNP